MCDRLWQLRKSADIFYAFFWYCKLNRKHFGNLRWGDKKLKNDIFQFPKWKVFFCASIFWKIYFVEKRWIHKKSQTKEKISEPEQSFCFFYSLCFCSGQSLLLLFFVQRNFRIWIIQFISHFFFWDGSICKKMLIQKMNVFNAKWFSFKWIYCTYVCIYDTIKPKLGPLVY